MQLAEPPHTGKADLQRAVSRAGLHTLVGTSR
jgi:hypothetical protein